MCMFMLRDQDCGWFCCTFRQLAANWVTIKGYITETTETDVGHISMLLISGGNISGRLQLINSVVDVGHSLLIIKTLL